MKQRASKFDRECSLCGANIPAGKLAWSEQEGLTERVECDECHEREETAIMEEFRNLGQQ